MAELAARLHSTDSTRVTATREKRRDLARRVKRKFAASAAAAVRGGTA
jgi:hypothetical protein